MFCFSLCNLLTLLSPCICLIIYIYIKSLYIVYYVPLENANSAQDITAFADDALLALLISKRHRSFLKRNRENCTHQNFASHCFHIEHAEKEKIKTLS